MTSGSELDRIDQLDHAPTGQWVWWEGGCLVNRIDARRYKAVKPHAVIWGYVDESAFYEDRWCYPTAIAALHAAELWNGPDGPEPEGWHRHPRTGRRRPDGDPTREHINP